MKFEERNKEIVLARLLDKKTYEAIGKVHGISADRVRQIIYEHARDIRENEERLTVRARNVVALTWWWENNGPSPEARKVWDELYDERRLLYLPTRAEINERRLVPINFLRTPNCGRSTLKEIVEWMQRKRYWLDVDSSGRPLP